MLPFENDEYRFKHCLSCREIVMTDQAKLKDSLWKSASEAFETMVMLPIQQVPKQVESMDESTSMIGSITFTGKLEGALLIQCSDSGAQKIAKSMLMAEEDEQLEEAEVKDALGEVANLVLGGFKSRIAESVGTIDLSVPTVVKGQKLRLVGKANEKIELAGTANGLELAITAAYSKAE